MNEILDILAEARVLPHATNQAIRRRRDDDQGSYTVSSIRALDSRRSLGLKQSLDCKLCLLQMHLYARSGQSTKDPGPWNWTSSICSEMGHRR